VNAPIAESLDNEMHDGSQDAKHLNGARAEAGYPDPPNISGQFSQQQVMSDLLDAQQQLISAQHQYLHDGNTPQLLRAQRDFIMRQTAAMTQLGMFG
jgi:hypothetical protein